MIRYEGREYGTAADIAARLGADITPAMIRRWAERDGLPRHRTPGYGTVLYPLDVATRIERDKRCSTRGRPRRLDLALAAAA